MQANLICDPPYLDKLPDSVSQLAALPSLPRLEFGHQSTVLENAIYSFDVLSNASVGP